MIERLWSLLQELGGYVGANFDPARDLVDVLLVTAGIYWLLLLIRGTRAVQILVGLVMLAGLFLASQAFDLATLSFILDNFVEAFLLIVIVVFHYSIGMIGFINDTTVFSNNRHSSSSSYE